MALLSRGEQIGGYTVQSLIKENLYTETYRVENEDANPFFLKVFVKKRLPEKLLAPGTGTVLEIEYCQRLKHRNIVSFIGKGTIDKDEGECPYYVTNYFSGELLAEKLQRDGKIGEIEALAIFRSILDGLQYMHEKGLYHNDITPRNIMLPTVPKGTPEIIDLGHTSERCTGKVPFDTSDLEALYCANETFGGLYDEQSDIFAATAVLFTMLTGTAPWNIIFSESMKRARRAMLIKEKRKEEAIDFEKFEFDDKIKVILSKGLAVAYQDRYRTIGQILADIDSETKPEVPKHKKEDNSQNSPRGGFSRDAESPNKVDFEIKRGSGNGFKDIAGMEELKSYLSQRVIFVIKNKEKVENSPN